MNKKIVLILVIILGATQTNFAQIKGLLGKGCFSGKEYKSNGYSSDYHKEHVGEIIFSNKTILQNDQSNLITTYNLGDDLHLRLFFPEEGIANTVFGMFEEDGLKNISKLSFVKRKLYEKTGKCLDGEDIIDGLAFKVQFYINGKKLVAALISKSELEEEDKQKYTTFRLGMSSKERYFGDGVLKLFSKEVSKLPISNGVHDVKVELIPIIQHYPKEFEGSVMASGTFKVKISDFDAANKTLCPFPNNKWEQGEQEELEAKVIKAFKKKGWKETPQRAIISTSNWIISRHEKTGVIVARFIEAFVLSTRDDECIYQSFNFYQDYDGSGFQENLYLSGVGSQYSVSCKCLK